MSIQHPFKLRKLGDGLNNVMKMMAYISEIQDSPDLICHFTTGSSAGRSVVRDRSCNLVRTDTLDRLRGPAEVR